MKHPFSCLDILLMILAFPFVVLWYLLKLLG